MLGGTRVDIEEKEFDVNEEIQKVFLNATERLLKQLKKEDEVNFLDLLETVGCLI